MALQLDDLIVIARTSSDQNFKATIADLVALVGGGSVGPAGPMGFAIPGMDGEDGNDGLTIPGKDGINGLPGTPAPIVPGLDGDEGDSAFPIPGPKGDTGNTGVAGKDGAIFFGEDGADGDAFPVPGPKGDTGTGIAGSTGPAGPLIWLPSYVDDPEEPMPSQYQFQNNSVYLGQITGTGVTVGPLVWNELFDLIYYEYQIGGYNGGTPVGRTLFGSAAITTIGLTNGNGLQEGATANATSVNVPGCPLAVTLSAVARSGWGLIRGASGALKQIDIHGQSGAVAVGTSPTVFSARSYFSDLGTNLPIKRIQLTVYDTLIATAVSVNAFIATTFIRAWGIRKGQQ